MQRSMPPSNRPRRLNKDAASWSEVSLTLIE
jgi:hypothetical protein